jgi:hypothetical protein
LPVQVFQGAAHVADALRERIVGYDYVRPYGIDQFVFGYKAAGICDEVAQKLEAFWS